jgi:hypothetical protein
MAQLTKKSPSSGHTDPATVAAEACLAVQQALGPDLVVVAPVDQAFIDVNWYVHASCMSYP